MGQHPPYSFAGSPVSGKGSSARPDPTDRSISGRPARKNDNCHVEQKNWAVVRRMVGYLRYHTPEHVAALNALYGRLRLYTNFFQPVQKLTAKERVGAKVRRHYDLARTPYQRVLAEPTIPQERKTALTEQYHRLNPAAIRREITELQQRLLDLALLPAASNQARKVH